MRHVHGRRQLKPGRETFEGFLLSQPVEEGKAGWFLPGGTHLHKEMRRVCEEQQGGRNTSEEEKIKR